MERNEQRARNIRLVVMDVDGTLTDGAMYYSASGEDLKRFSTRDGMGITLLHRSGIGTAIITSETSPIVTARSAKLRIEDVLLGSHDKTTTLLDLARRKGLSAEHIAYIGDDVNDLHVMGICGLTACPSDAVSSIRDIAHIVCARPGGNGAVREFAEYILLAQGRPVTLPEQW
jgi:YrbI family 3-deoxy-D-manno-octulosonate 8-phosphate phosphatase